MCLSPHWDKQYSDSKSVDVFEEDLFQQNHKGRNGYEKSIWSMRMKIRWLEDIYQQLVEAECRKANWTAGRNVSRA